MAAADHAGPAGSGTTRNLSVLAKWRTLLAGWQLGTRPKNDPECAAVSDHREATLLLRTEMNALGTLLVRKGVIAARELDAAIGEEALLMSRDLERRFPGVTASETGLHMDMQVIMDAGWMAGWKP